jgi:hypothetical protein
VSLSIVTDVVAFYNKRGTCEQWIKEGNGLARLLAQSSQSTDLRTYQPLSSRVEMYSVVQSSPVAPTALFDCAT